MPIRCCPALKIPISAALTMPMKNRAFRTVPGAGTGPRGARARLTPARAPSRRGGCPVVTPRRGDDGITADASSMNIYLELLALVGAMTAEKARAAEKQLHLLLPFVGAMTARRQGPVLPAVRKCCYPS